MANIAVQVFLRAEDHIDCGPQGDSKSDLGVYPVLHLAGTTVFPDHKALAKIYDAIGKYMDAFNEAEAESAAASEADQAAAEQAAYEAEMARRADVDF